LKILPGNRVSFILNLLSRSFAGISLAIKVNMKHWLSIFLISFFGTSVALSQESFETQVDQYVANSQLYDQQKKILKEDLMWLGQKIGNSNLPLAQERFSTGIKFEGKEFIHFLSTNSVGLFIDWSKDGPTSWVIEGSPHVRVVSEFFNAGRIERLGMLFHEVIHLATQDFPHAQCPIPFRDANNQDIRSGFTGIVLAGLGACDSSITGAYSSQVIFFRNLGLNCTNCSTGERAEALRLANAYSQRILDNEVRNKLLDIR
jgi:hypothetical protein